MIIRTREEVYNDLVQVNAAIVAIVTGSQSYTIGDRSVTKANLAELQKLKDDLINELGEIDNGGSAAVSMGWYGR